MTQRTLVISDIHGCYEPFNQLLDLMSYEPKVDQLILLGDYVDRGPHSKEVVEQIRKMVQDDGVIALRGNHDQRFIDIVRTEDHLVSSKFVDHGGKQTMMSYLNIDTIDYAMIHEELETFKQLVRTEHAAHVAFLESLPYYYEAPAHIFVHAGLDPKYVDWQNQPTREFMYIKEPFFKNKTVVNKVVVFGHTKTKDIQGTPDIWFGGDKIGVDGGCAFGMQLNGLEITDTDTYRTFKVQA
ncbi:metallophosphoesterase family protein [Paenibacillus sp. FSL H8-0034]|uniref:metallophosphoesterase family protein n=1 Tax=Paenibacillus sp. FSL H8-0034 TaxID=2954671 RepID=UPI0030F86601